MRGYNFINSIEEIPISRIFKYGFLFYLVAIVFNIYLALSGFEVRWYFLPLILSWTGGLLGLAIEQAKYKGVVYHPVGENYSSWSLPSILPVGFALVPLTSFYVFISLKKYNKTGVLNYQRLKIISLFLVVADFLLYLFLFKNF